MKNLSDKELYSLIKKMLTEDETPVTGPGKGEVSVSDMVNPKFDGMIDTNKLSTSQGTEICKAGSEGCAQFVNDYSDKIDYVGDAWLAHNNEKMGKRIYTSFHKLNPTQIKTIIDLWNSIDKKGGGVAGGSFTKKVSSLVNSLVPMKYSGPKLEVDDIVGIYYPPSKNHEIAFYEAGKPYFIGSTFKYYAKGLGTDPYHYKFENGKFYFAKKNSYNKETGKFNWVEAKSPNSINAIKTTKFHAQTKKVAVKKPGKTIMSGAGWGMNTHVGIVGAIKDGVPIIFHNIHGNVMADPYNKISGDGRIAWVRRPEVGFLKSVKYDLSKKYPDAKEYIKNKFF